MTENLRRPTILVVDDIKENVDILTGILSDRYALKIAMSGAQAIKIALSATPPDLILLDITMPDMDGYQVCAKLRENSATEAIPVIFVTANTSINDITRGFDVGGVDYITKPFNPSELLARVSTHLTLMDQKKRLQMLAENLGKYLPPQLYRMIFSGERNVEIRTERKFITICFADIVNFTPLSESLSNEKLSHWLNGYLNRMAEIAISHGGTLDKFMGDAVMVFFGDPTTSGREEDARKCVAMARDMVNAASEFDVEVRVGISSGEVRVGNFGSENHMEYSVIGREVNVAARLQSSSEPSRILISENTRQLIAPEIACDKRGIIKVKGIDRDIETFWVVQANTRDTR